jgi:hypothetical protein
MWVLLAMLGCEWERWMCGHGWGFFLGIDVDVQEGSYEASHLCCYVD